MYFHFLPLNHRNQRIQAHPQYLLPPPSTCATIARSNAAAAATPACASATPACASAVGRHSVANECFCDSVVSEILTPFSSRPLKDIVLCRSCRTGFLPSHRSSSSFKRAYGCI